jgi:hypothetical protein
MGETASILSVAMAVPGRRVGNRELAHAWA